MRSCRRRSRLSSGRRLNSFPDDWFRRLRHRRFESSSRLADKGTFHMSDSGPTRAKDPMQGRFLCVATELRSKWVRPLPAVKQTSRSRWQPTLGAKHQRLRTCVEGANGRRGRKDAQTSGLRQRDARRGYCDSAWTMVKPRSDSECPAAVSDRHRSAWRPRPA